MFTGLVADLGRVERIARSDQGARLRIATRIAGEIADGDSIAVNGACLTAAACDGGAFESDVMNQTLDLTSLGQLEDGDSVNLEPALRAQDRLGGHIVQGHVDGTGEVLEVAEDGLARRVRIAASQELLRHVVERGSVAVDGVSLTVASLKSDGDLSPDKPDGDRAHASAAAAARDLSPKTSFGSFEVSLIPETLSRTNLGGVEPGRVVNLETDILAKYVERLAGPAIAERSDR